jgi:competence protein ComEA
MKKLIPLAAASIMLAAALPSLAQTDSGAPASKPPATVPSGGRGMPGDASPVNTVPSGGRGMNDVNGASSKGGATDMVDVNSAGESELRSIGLKSSEAKAIVKYREQNGPFTSQTQLSSIKGLSKQGAEKLKGRVQFGSQSPGGDATPGGLGG